MGGAVGGAKEGAWWGNILKKASLLPPLALYLQHRCDLKQLSLPHHFLAGVEIFGVWWAGVTLVCGAFSYVAGRRILEFDDTQDYNDQVTLSEVLRVFFDQVYLLTDATMSNTSRSGVRGKQNKVMIRWLNET